MEIIDFSTLGAPEQTAPAADNLIAGDPHHQVWNAFSDIEGRFHVGRWASTAGMWRVKYTEHELCHMMSGVIRVTADSGQQHVYRGGDTFLISKGFSGTWEVIEACSKIYAIYQ